MNITLTTHEAREFVRMAFAAFNARLPDLGNRLAVAAKKQELSIEEYDELASIYRAWLVFNEFPFA